ncbi:hypothetical protein LC085_03580 [Bacillus tianshenii]|uniref:hypothetical protein n=1 Tax=Sutcliffiella tianshenii TaxID=1463404 RepID=UPI001CD3D2DE|nr:hypothetical protein [Bacillus tianshenii]MCA1318981.1 hypothetical protein [Bacillus tianshenii]
MLFASFFITVRHHPVLVEIATRFFYYCMWARLEVEQFFPNEDHDEIEKTPTKQMCFIGV